MASDILFPQPQLDNGRKLEYGLEIAHQMILSRLDNEFSPSQSDRLVQLFSNNSNKGYESLIKSLEHLIIGVKDETPIIDSDAYFSKFVDLLLHTGSDPIESIRTVHSMVLEQFKVQAMQSGSLGIATRYALVNLNPYVLNANPLFYSQHNLNGELELENYKYTDSYIKDRATMLLDLVKRNHENSSYSSATTNGYVYEDKTTGITIGANRIRSRSGQISPLPADVNRIIFAGDTGKPLIGGGNYSRLHGGIEDDTLITYQSEAYMEGGVGDDSYQITFSSSEALSHGILDADGKGHILINGQRLLSGYRLDGAGNYRYGNFNYTYDGVSQSLIITSSDYDSPHNQITIQNYTHGDLGIELFDESPSPEYLTSGDDSIALTEGQNGVITLSDLGETLSLTNNQKDVTEQGIFYGGSGHDAITVHADLPGVIITGDGDGSEPQSDGHDLILIQWNNNDVPPLYWSMAKALT